MTQPYPGVGVVETADTEQMAAVDADANPFAELGVTGLRRAAGYVDEEFLPNLKGRKAIQVYREMGDNSPIVGAMLFAIVQLIRDIEWTIEPAGKSVDDNKAAKLVETCKDDMSHSWDEMVAEIVWGALQYGWSYNEIVYKRRGGIWAKDGRHRSKYSDGLIGWRRIPVRSQDTLLRWAFDEGGGIAGMVQLSPPDYATRWLPIERSLLFRYGTHKNNPEGRSLLRNAYRPWYYLKRLEEFEAVGVERDLAGLPVVKMPTSYLRAPLNSPQGKMTESLRKLVRGVRRNENEGVLFPWEWDEDSNKEKFVFELMSSGGARQWSTNDLITRYEQRILMTCLADWLMVGHTATGTYNLHVDKTGVFRSALNAVAKGMVADVFNRHAIPRLFARNGWKPAALPTLVPGNVDTADLSQLGSFLAATAQVGVNWAPDEQMDRWLREQAGMPQLAEEDMGKHRRMARYAEAARLSQLQTEALAARSQLAQALAAEKMTAAGEPLPEHADALAGAAQQGQAAQADAHAQGQADESFATEQAGAKLTQAQGWSALLSPDTAGQNGAGGKKK